MRLAQIVALFMAWQMAPNLAEFVENIVHLAATGHTAHTLDDEQHAAEGDEHGCSGTFHVCPCHSSLTFVMSNNSPGVRAPTVAAVLASPETESPLRDGFLASIFRPPRA